MLQAFFENPELQKFFLIFARLSGLVIFAPPFMNTRLSIQFKGGLVFILAIAMFPVASTAKVVIPFHFIDLAFALGFEIFIGFIIGFAVQLLFVSFQLAGEFIDKHIGFAMASLVDPQTDITVSILGSLLMNLGLFVFLDAGGHLWILKTFAGSFSSIPLLETQFQMEGILYHMSNLFLSALKFAVSFSLPIIIMVTMIYVVQGFLQRTMPQFQIFVVGFIFTISVGIMSIRLILQHFIPTSYELIDHFQQQVWFIITHING